MRVCKRTFLAAYPYQKSHGILRVHLRASRGADIQSKVDSFPLALYCAARFQITNLERQHIIPVVIFLSSFRSSQPSFYRGINHIITQQPDFAVI